MKNGIKTLAMWLIIVVIVLVVLSSIVENSNSRLKYSELISNINSNNVKSIVIEAAELLECFQWCDDNFNLQHVKEELADVLVYSQNLLDKLGLDADEIVNMKMDQNEAKYPVEKAKGSAAKYTEL